MWCPACQMEVEAEHFACRSGAKGGASGTGDVKARSSEQARAAVRERWRRAGKYSGEKVIGESSQAGKVE